MRKLKKGSKMRKEFLKRERKGTWMKYRQYRNQMKNNFLNHKYPQR